MEIKKKKKYFFFSLGGGGGGSGWGGVRVDVKGEVKLLLIIQSKNGEGGGFGWGKGSQGGCEQRSEAFCEN